MESARGFSLQFNETIHEFHNPAPRSAPESSVPESLQNTHLRKIRNAFFQLGTAATATDAHCQQAGGRFPSVAPETSEDGLESTCADERSVDDLGVTSIN